MGIRDAIKSYLQGLDHGERNESVMWPKDDDYMEGYAEGQMKFKKKYGIFNK